MADTPQSLRARLVGSLDQVELHSERRDPLYDTLCARLANGTAAVKLGISVDIVAPGKRSCPYHFHYAQEEAFVVLDGEGTLRAAGEMLAIGRGDVIFVPSAPQYPHQIINTSGPPLKYMSIGTRDSLEVVECPDSGKYLAMAAGTVDGAAHAFARMHRTADDLDYWHGEP